MSVDSVCRGLVKGEGWLTGRNIGVWMQATASQVWRATGGKFNSEFFKYKIGGEW